MGVLRSGARGNMPATAKRLASWRVLKEMLKSFLRRCSLLDVLESLTVGTCVQHFFQVLSRGGGSLAQVFACPGHNFFFPCPILRFACPVFVDKCTQSHLIHGWKSHNIASCQVNIQDNEQEKSSIRNHRREMHHEI